MFQIPHDLRDRLQMARRVLILTGAGVSAESGIPTFRDAMIGLWERFDAEQLATLEAFREDPDLVWGWYEWRRAKSLRAEPNAAHQAIAQWGARSPGLVVVTQNVDDLHERAGSLNVIHLHGSLHSLRCVECGRKHGLPEGVPDEPEGGRRLDPPLCAHCNSLVRPGVVWFGEGLPPSAWIEAQKAAESCDLMICAGTSALVYPAAELPHIAARRGAAIIQVNPQLTPLDETADFSLHGLAGLVMPALFREAASLGPSEHTIALPPNPESRDAMGILNSSVTRVWPIFDWLLQSDPTGAKWLSKLLRLGSRVKEVDQNILSDPGNLCARLALVERPLPGQLRQAARVALIRNAYEVPAPPPAAFLRWLLKNPEKLTWPKVARGRERVFGRLTQQNRKHLLAGEPFARRQGLEELARVGACGSRRKWWAFEGFTSVDCLLETKSLLLLTEGKRTEPIANSTDWFPDRNQIIRNLEVAQALANGRNFAVLLCAERPEELPEKAWTNGLPHFSPAEIKELKRHYLGCATWPTIAKELCDGLPLL
jgi:NAD-dependent deacetylase